MVRSQNVVFNIFFIHQSTNEHPIINRNQNLATQMLMELHIHICPVRTGVFTLKIDLNIKSAITIKITLEMAEEFLI